MSHDQTNGIETEYEFGFCSRFVKFKNLQFLKKFYKKNNKIKHQLYEICSLHSVYNHNKFHVAQNHYSQLYLKISHPPRQPE